MRIIQGRLKGFRFPTYNGSNTRPTSDLVKESLFNILSAHIDVEGLSVCDLFAGTGNIGLEFVSRGAKSLISVDHFAANIQYMKKIKPLIDFDSWTIVKADVNHFISKIPKDVQLVFADPPYDLPNIHQLVNNILESDWFQSENAFFILEHNDRLIFNHKEVFLNKQYGITSFTFFKK